MIGKPASKEDDGKIENLLEQLRLRQLSLEQIETYSKQEQAADKRKDLNNAMATATMQEELTQSKIKIEIISNQAEADLAKARKDAERRVVTARADSESIALEGRGKSESVNLIGAAEAKVLSQKVESFGDSKLYAISLVADSLAHSQQPLVPETMLGSDGAHGGMLGTLMSLLVADKLGIPVPTHRQPALPAEVKEEPKK